MQGQLRVENSEHQDLLQSICYSASIRQTLVCPNKLYMYHVLGRATEVLATQCQSDDGPDITFEPSIKLVPPSSEILPPIEVSETRRKICDVHVTAPPPPPEEKSELQPQSSAEYVDETNDSDNKPAGNQSSRQKHVYNRRTVRTVLSPTMTTTGGQSGPCLLGIVNVLIHEEVNYEA